MDVTKTHKEEGEPTLNGRVKVTSITQCTGPEKFDPPLEHWPDLEERDEDYKAQSWLSVEILVFECTSWDGHESVAVSRSGISHSVIPPEWWDLN